MNFKGKLPIPKEVKERFPLTKEMTEQKARNDEEIKKIFSGESDKFLLVIRPCSADYKDAVLDYIHRLRKVQEKVEDKIIDLMISYTGEEKHLVATVEDEKVCISEKKAVKT